MSLVFNYSSEFFRQRRAGSKYAASVIVPFLVELLNPQSVLDVGCGWGTWLSAFHELGVDKICGIDGDYISPDALEVPSTSFLALDLAQPFDLHQQFDLVISLEVAEHLPAESAVSFVQSLTRHAPVVAFSAAIPHQGGKHHVNEQWMDYWARHFADAEYLLVDCLRPHFWNCEHIDYWYAQNAFMFVDRDRIMHYPSLAGYLRSNVHFPLAAVHPRKYEELLASSHDKDAELWRCYEELASYDIRHTLPVGSTFALADEGRTSLTAVPDRSGRRVCERHGQYSGAPPDDGCLLAEFHALQTHGVKHLVISWPSFWWLDFYASLSGYLNEQSEMLLHNDRVAIFQFHLS